MAETSEEPISSALEDARAAQKAGILDQLPPAVRARMLKALEPEMVHEREEALKPKQELMATPAKSSFIESLLAPLRGNQLEYAREMADKDRLKGMSVARGAARAFNPLPVVNLLTPGAPHIPDDLETLEALGTFPIIRGAELAARMFVPEDQRPSLTTFSQVVRDQRDMDKRLRQLTPGVQEGAEAGVILGSGMSLASTGLKLADKVARGSIRAVQKGIQEYRATKATQKATDLAYDIADVSDGPLLDSILLRPEKVKEQMTSGSKTAKDIAAQLKDEITFIGKNLGENVGKFRKAALEDTTTRLTVPQELTPLIQRLRSWTTLDGKSQIPAKLEKNLQAAEKMMSFGVTTPNQAMILNDSIQDIIDFGNSGDKGSNAVKTANVALIEIRKSLKSMLRQDNSFGLAQADKLKQSGRADMSRNDLAYQLWADADNKYSGFKGVTDGVLSKLESDSAASVVDDLLSKRKTILRDRIEQGLEYMEAIDPTARGHGAAFFSRLADLKTADRLKDVKIGVDRVKQEKTHEIVRHWKSIGEKIGGVVGGGPASIAAAHAGNPTIAAATGATGYFTGSFIGGLAGQAVGKRLADPTRILDQAIKAKNLSASARRLAQDMLYLNKSFGPEANIAFMDLVGPIPAVNELIKFTNSLTKGEDNARSKKGN